MRVVTLAEVCGGVLQERFRTITSSYYRGAHGIIVVRGFKAHRRLYHSTLGLRVIKKKKKKKKKKVRGFHERCTARCPPQLKVAPTDFFHQSSNTRLPPEFHHDMFAIGAAPFAWQSRPTIRAGGADGVSLLPCVPRT